MAGISHVEHRSGVADRESGDVAIVYREGVERQALAHARIGGRIGYFRDAITAGPIISNPEVTGSILVARVDETDRRAITRQKHDNGGRRRISVRPVFIPGAANGLVFDLVLDLFHDRENMASVDDSVAERAGKIGAFGGRAIR